MNGPWPQEQIDAERRVRFSAALDQLGAYHKRDADCTPLEPGRKSVRFQVSYQSRDFRFIVTGDKFVNELLPEGMPGRGGGGAIDFVRHITGYNFAQAVKVCLDALSGMPERL